MYNKWIYSGILERIGEIIRKFINFFGFRGGYILFEGDIKKGFMEVVEFLKNKIFSCKDNSRKYDFSVF